MPILPGIGKALFSGKFKPSVDLNKLKELQYSTVNLENSVPSKEPFSSHYNLTFEQLMNQHR